MRFASIDIGTNTVLMVIADVDKDGNINVIKQDYGVARLGEGVDNDKVINDNAIERASAIFSNYREICDQLNVEYIFACGTSALRDARNSKEVVDKIYKASGIEINIISGDEEAYLSYLGAVEGIGTNMLIDIGGGSTEFIIGNANNILFKKSLDIGAVRMTERFFSSQPPKSHEINNMISYVKYLISDEVLKNIDLSTVNKFFADAGTATTIATTANNLKDYEVDKIEGYILNKNTLDDIFEKYSQANSDFIVANYGVHPRRADLITAGTIILKSSFELFDINEVTISSRGLRFGFLIQESKKFFNNQK